MAASSLTINIAGVGCEVRFPDARCPATLHERYTPFLTDEQPDWHVTVLWDASISQENPGWAEHDGAFTRFHIHQYRGEIDLVAQAALVTAPALERGSSASERVLGFIYMQALPRAQNALLLHASGVVINGQGFVFFGPSGAGKTTVARLADGYGTVLTDENVVLRLRDNCVDVCSTPFWGHSTPPEMIHRVDRCVPVAALFALVHAPTFSLTPLSPGQAIAALLTTEKVATERVESATAWLRVACSIIHRVTTYNLAFCPTAELWTFLARHIGEKLV